MKNTSLLMMIASMVILLSCKESPQKMEGGSMVTQQIENGGPYQLIDGKAARALIAQNSDLVIIDVRTPREFDSGSIPDAILIDYNGDGFTEKIKTLDRDKTYLVYCQSGGRSKHTSDLMQELGFQHIYELKGGFPSF